MKHSVSAHHRRYDRKTGETSTLTPGELSDEMKRVRRAQYRGKSLATFSPSGAPEKQFRGKKVHPVELPEDTDSVGSIEFQPEPEPVDLFHTTGQPSTSRSAERPLTLPLGSLSVRSEDVDVSLLDNTLALDTVSTASISAPPSRTSTPLLCRPAPVVPPVPQAPADVICAPSISAAADLGCPSTSGTVPAVPSVYSPQHMRVWSGLMLSSYVEEPVQAFTELLAEQRPAGISDEQLERATATFLDYEAGHRQALALVHNILRRTDLSSPDNVLLAVAEVVKFTRQSLNRPYEDSSESDTLQPIEYDNVSNDSEGALIIDIPTEEDSDPSQYSEDSDATVSYAAE